MEPKQAEGWREIIADLRTQLQQAQEERGSAWGWAEATNQRYLRVLEDARRFRAECDEAIERGRLMWREYLAQVGFGRVLIAVRAEAAEALVQRGAP